MVFDTGKNNVQKSLAHSPQRFQISTGNKIFRILSDSIYVQKIDAVIRELCCNAYDAHIEAKQDKRFLVKLPNDLDLEFKVRDFGLGLSHEDMSIYTT
jgi:HSP90 family molecular chaperone